MDYQTFEPREELKDLIKFYWTLEAPYDQNSVRQRIIPDGCMEMIFHYGDLYKQFLHDGNEIVQPRCFVFGQITEPLEIQATGVTGIFSVRFFPNGFDPFSIFPIESLENKANPLSILFPSHGELLEMQILNANDTSERIQIIESFLIDALKKEDTVDRVSTLSVERLLQSRGQLKIENLSVELNISRRSLERKFSSVIGMSPKQFAKVIRLQACLQLMEKGEYKSLTSLAYESGYFDQAHFIKDFKEFTGVSPKEFYSDHLKLSALFIASE